MGSEEQQQQLSDYVRFVETVLKPKLLAAESGAAAVRTEIADYRELARHLHDRIRSGTIDRPIDSEVDLGHRRVFCAARVENPARLFVGVGLGFHVELTPEEATGAAERRVSFLEAHRLKAKESEIEEIKTHISSASMILDRLHRTETVDDR